MTGGESGGLPSGAIRGVIEGFYGPPWSWDERRLVMAFCAARGMTHYVHAPKDDPLQRTQWRSPWGAEHLAGYSELVAAGTLEVGTAISPGLSIDYDDAGDRNQLAAKVGQVVEVGVRLVVLCLDDIAPRAGLGVDHALLANDLADRFAGRARVVLVPTDYTSTTRVGSAYLADLAAHLDRSIDVAWTGPGVVNDVIDARQALERAEALGGRPPLVWDNYPVNDAIMADRLFTGPLRGRDPHLRSVCSGWLANPGVQARASLPALASIAAWCDGEDPEVAWEGLLAGEFAQSAVVCVACDGEAVAALVEDLVDSWWSSRRHHALAALDDWLARAATASAPDLGDDVGGWVDQVRLEASAGRTAVALLQLVADTLDTLQGPGSQEPGAHTRARPGAEAVGLGLALGAQWAAARRAIHTVFGPRTSVRPTMGQRGEGEWVWRPGAVLADGNALDRLARFAFAQLDATVAP